MPGPQELLVIAVVALLVFGPDRLPEVMRNIAKFIARFREYSQSSIEELKQAAEVDELNREIDTLRREMRGATGMIEREVSGASRQARQAARDVTAEVGGEPAPDAISEAGPPPMDPEAT